jgi:hypothetical protein
MSITSKSIWIGIGYLILACIYAGLIMLGGIILLPFAVAIIAKIIYFRYPRADNPFLRNSLIYSSKFAIIFSILFVSFLIVGGKIMGEYILFAGFAFVLAGYVIWLIGEIIVLIYTAFRSDRTPSPIADVPAR